MADKNADMTKSANEEFEPLRKAFGLLASAELGRIPDWCPGDSKRLRTRVNALVQLMDILPRNELGRLDEVIRGWNARFDGDAATSGDELRRIAREILRTPSGESDSLLVRESNLRRAMMAIRLPNSGVTTQAMPLSASELVDDIEAERLCAFGLSTWLSQLGDNPRWTHVPPIVPGEARIPIENIYVDLYAISDPDIVADDPRGYESWSRISGRRLSGAYPVVSALTMISRTLERCVVIGEPGSGKSTLVQWIARAIYHRESPDFETALVIKLSAFAAHIAEDPACTLIEFFFESLGTKITDWRTASRRLRQAASANRRFLLMLDGWDEVPTALRERVLEQIVFEQPYFTLLITSRPSGLPRQLAGQNRASTYHVAGLTERAKAELVTRLLATMGRPDLVEVVLERIRLHTDLDQMAGNPFLLGLLVRVLARATADEKTPRTRGDLYGQVVTWIQELYNANASTGDRLTSEHIKALRRLSYDLLLDSSDPRYIIRDMELAESLGDLRKEPVLRSRFINRIDLIFDEYAFIHASFQEYFAAVHAGTLSEQELGRLMDRALHSVGRVIVLQFMAGLGGDTSEHCRRQAAKWLRAQDRFRQIVIRVARIAAAGRWPATDSHGVGRILRDELWNDIKTDGDMAQTRDAAEAYAELDATELCRRARKAKGLPNWALECIINAVPKDVLRRERFDELLPGLWRDYMGMEVKGGATDAEKKAICRLLANPAQDKEDRKEAAVHAGAARDRDAVPLLLRIANDNSEHEDVLEQVVYSLGIIAGREAVDGLVNLVLGTTDASKSMVNMATAVLRHSGHSAKALDPVGRDRLLRRLAVLRTNDEHMIPILSALEGYPIRDGAELIAELAESRDLPSEIRTRSVAVLASISDRRLAEQAVSSIETEESSEVVSYQLNVALSRSLPVPMKWLERKISVARDKRNHLEFLLAFVQLLPFATPDSQDRGYEFLNELINRALSGDAARTKELAEALERGLAMVGDHEFSVSETNSMRARILLREFAERPYETSTAHVILAAAICGHSSETKVIADLRAALDTSVGLSGSSTQTGTLTDSGRIASAIARAVAKIAPGELLGYPLDCLSVNSVLRGLTTRRGWLIFGDRIVNADGEEIVSISKGVADVTLGASTSELGDLIARLPRQSANVLYSYWLMVKPGGPCRPGDSLRTIYEKMATMDSEGGLDVDLVQTLESLFDEKGCPTFDTWRQTLGRVQRQFANQPALRDELRRIGLGRRRPRA